MKTESLNIFDANGIYLGVSSRDEIHKHGYWHETFHCWIISQEGGKNFIHFQVRSAHKKDYPGLLDISAAGHLLANEKVSDGIREVHEELGINVSIEDLISLGTIPDEIIQNDIIDRELGHTFMYLIPLQLKDKYVFQVEEVSGIIKIDINSFNELWKEEINEILVEGIVFDEQNQVRNVSRTVQKKDFLPHDDSYITKVMELIKNNLLE